LAGGSEEEKALVIYETVTFNTVKLQIHGKMVSNLAS